jgi:polysaccharide deacetylase 2 family uncharacterized protein YibQ
MSLLPETIIEMSEQSLSNEIHEPKTEARFAGLPLERALEVANLYLTDSHTAPFLAAYFENDMSLSVVAASMNIDSEETARILIDQLESQVAEAHLANIPRRYGHAADLLLIIGGKTSD